MNMNVIFSDYMTDCVRILILISSAKKHKSIKLTENRIRLYDYYFRFPFTMIENEAKEAGMEMNVDEHYAFFHWQPDVIRYRQILNYLVAKGFVMIENENEEKLFCITETGDEVIQKIENSYKDKLLALSDPIMKKLKSVSDTKIGDEIREKTNLLSKKGWRV